MKTAKTRKPSDSNSKPRGKKVTFETQSSPGSEVFVAGTFNDWNPRKNRMRDNPDSGHYKAALILPPGRHEYKFVVDGEWIMDSRVADWAPNGLGSLNSVIAV
jgi:1,4-alpha-glucan branching enzyme